MAGKRRDWGAVRRIDSGKFQASYIDPKTKKRIPKTFDKKGDANAWLANVKADITRGVLGQPVQDKTTFAEYVETWFASRPKPLAESTVETYRRSLRLHILPTFGDRPISKIVASDVRDWFAERGKNAGPGARAMAYTVLNAIMCTWTDDNEVANPCKIKGGRTTEPPAEEEILSPEQIATVAYTVEPRFRAMVLVGAYAHLRYGELAGLRRRDFHIKGSKIVLEEQLRRRNGKWVRRPPKNNSARTIRIPKAVAAALAEHLLQYVDGDPDALIFTTEKNEPIHLSRFNHMLKRAGATIGRPDLHSHLLRHSGLTWWTQNGGTVAEAAKRAGHSSLETAMKYQHGTDERDEELTKLMNDKVVIPSLRTGARSAVGS